MPWAVSAKSRTAHVRQPIVSISLHASISPRFNLPTRQFPQEPSTLTGCAVLRFVAAFAATGVSCWLPNPYWQLQPC